jgi:hypothetical protein
MSGRSTLAVRLAAAAVLLPLLCSACARLPPQEGSALVDALGVGPGSSVGEIGAVGGALSVIDFPPSLLLAPWTPEGTLDRGGRGIEAQTLIAELSAGGFEPTRVIEDRHRGDLLQRFDCARFRDPADAGSRRP